MVCRVLRSTRSCLVASNNVLAIFSRALGLLTSPARVRALCCPTAAASADSCTIMNTAGAGPDKSRYSITSSALSSRAGDTVRPRVFAVRFYSRVVFAMSLSRSEALAGIAQTILQSLARTVLKHRRSNMVKFPSTLEEEHLLTCEVSDEALETAGGKEIAAIFTLGSCTGLSECPA